MLESLDPNSDPTELKTDNPTENFYVHLESRKAFTETIILKIH